MENNLQDKSLLEDKALAEALVSKEDLAKYNANTTLVDEAYFEYQANNILKTVKSKKAPILRIGLYSKIAIAASLFAVLATAFLYFQTKKSMDPTPIIVKIEEIPTAELEAYVNSNEYIFEADMQNEINEEVAMVSTINIDTELILDTNKISN
jgi:hypothetical protein